ncbi:FAD-binding protein [Pseudonocardia xinjiangensis]|uniref:FAD-binding protein n=1 Tax=Pseudonocardia xinjiangensis TaxID=75289 RepID=UPI001B7D086B|nr:FAD-binding protein [Pseudonocardia xinjiangensis]
MARATTADDVRASIRFARDNALACVPKSGGQSFGASTVENALVVDVGPLNGISYADNVVTVGAGAGLYDIHSLLDKYGRSLPTGAGPTIGISGPALGGGMGIHTRGHDRPPARSPRQSHRAPLRS